MYCGNDVLLPGISWSPFVPPPLQGGLGGRGGRRTGSIPLPLLFHEAVPAASRSHTYVLQRRCSIPMPLPIDAALGCPGLMQDSEVCLVALACKSQNTALK